MEPKLLEEIGLTEGEVKVYLSLLKLGLTTTGPLATDSEVSSSKVYKILYRLEVKGLVSHVLKGETKYFKALEPKRILDYIDEREKQLQKKKVLVQKMLPELEKQRKLGEKTEGTVYKGFKSVTNFFRNIVDELDEGETYNVIGTGSERLGRPMFDFFAKHHKRRAAKKIRLKMLASYGHKEKLAKSTFINSEVKFLPENMSTFLEIVFYRNKSFLVAWSEEPLGFLIESEEIKNSFERYFNNFWTQNWSVYEGDKGVKQVLEMVFTDLRKGQTDYVINAKGPSKHMRDYIESWHDRLEEQGINFKIIYGAAESELIRNRVGRPNAEVRVLPKDFASPAAIKLFGSKVAIILWSKRPRAFLIEDRQLFHSFKNYFDVLWAMGKVPR